jgi:hypothetical protein
MSHREARKEGHSTGDCGEARNAKRAYGAEMLRSPYTRGKGGKPSTVMEDGAEDRTHDWKVWETAYRSSGKPSNSSSGS